MQFKRGEDRDVKWIDEGREREMEELMERENFREREMALVEMGTKDCQGL